MAIKQYAANTTRRAPGKWVNFIINAALISADMMEVIRDKTAVRIGVDPDARRMYFQFCDEKKHGDLTISKRNSDVYGRFSMMGLYTLYEWLGDLQQKPSEDRRFEFHPTKLGSEAHQMGYEYFIEVGKEGQHAHMPTLQPTI
jgi:hypothetical protein